MPASPTPAKPAPAKALAPGRELPLAPHLSEPLEKPWLQAYQATLGQLQQQLGKRLAAFATPPAKRR